MCFRFSSHIACSFWLSPKHRKPRDFPNEERGMGPLGFDFVSLDFAVTFIFLLISFIYYKAQPFKSVEFSTF